MQPVVEWLRSLSLVLTLIPLGGTALAIAGQDAVPSTPSSVAGTLPPVGLATPASGRYSFAFLNPYPADTFWQIVQQSIEDRAGEVGIAVDVFGLASPSVPEQIEQLEAVAATGYDGIIVGVIDPVGVVPGILAANAGGIPVVAIDVPPAGGRIVSLVRSDDIAAARAAGEFVARAINGEGVVLNLQGDMTHPVAQARDRGLREALAAFPGIELVSRSGQWSEGAAFAITSERVPAVPVGTPTAPEGMPAAVETEDVPRAIFAANEQMASGARSAVTAVDRDDIVIVGFGSILQGAELVANGDLAAVVAPFPARMGATAVDLMARYLEGEDVAAEVDAGFVLVTEQNVDRFLPEGE